MQSYNIFVCFIFTTSYWLKTAVFGSVLPRSSKLGVLMIHKTYRESVNFKIIGSCPELTKLSTPFGMVLKHLLSEHPIIFDLPDAWESSQTESQTFSMHMAWKPCTPKLNMKLLLWQLRTHQETCNNMITRNGKLSLFMY